MGVSYHLPTPLDETYRTDGWNRGTPYAPVGWIGILHYPNLSDEIGVPPDSIGWMMGIKLHVVLFAPSQDHLRTAPQGYPFIGVCDR